MERFHGALTALVTPFIDGKLDEKGLVDLIEFQIENGIHGIVPCGTTGESATLDFDEHKRVIDLTVRTVNGRVPVVAGTGANNTLEAIELTESAKDSGADAVLSVAPYYNKPSQEGLYLHFKTIAEAVDIPVVLYNVPGRTVIHILPETVARLAEIDNIIGIKEACASLEQITDVIRFCPADFILLSGDDFTSMPTALIGGKGVISVISNVDPSGMSRMMEAAMKGNLQVANEEHYRLFTMMKLMFKSPSPGPAKKALEMLGRIQDGSPRLPMTPADEQTTQALVEEMSRLGML
ncbi:MAG: 4-hydroxy-tetrahydrodipicolinate synthase [Desulfofustis sp.]|nr:4-hydroxy-tetrahydrodipicolinate synthase [Desulfofustis sp.]MBT8346078.1 4-hydroxy-tetrahydrodipicolinate synthase [Desulfofustis sp.]MBT8353191.1 4-hydroxy-tetrahydrodipicolinate synthase [Desulfofustis sp.]NNF47775.1 4-hydroxy-tetrahydrodipicolinate synthase [Desulfofustis sp.]NNK13370.1 4-hydroxy-tetrahydrodipicolinate synthase [Desulfofustis sp.]